MIEPLCTSITTPLTLRLLWRLSGIVWEALCIWLAQHLHSQNNVYYYCFIFQIFIWIGKDANEVEKSESLKSGKLDPVGNYDSNSEQVLPSSWLLFSPHPPKPHIKTKKNLSFHLQNWRVMEFFLNEEFQKRNKKNIFCYLI